MKLFHIVAMSRDRVIGKDNKLPWHFSEDLKRFKTITMGQTVLMGRKTFESIVKPLPGRENFVLSRTCHSEAGGRRISEQRSFAPRSSPLGSLRMTPIFFNSIDKALAAVKTEKAFVIGGADLYRQTIGRVDGIYLTLVKGSYAGDAFYPAIPETFKETGRDPAIDPALEFIFYSPLKKERSFSR